MASDELHAMQDTEEPDHCDYTKDSDGDRWAMDSYQNPALQVMCCMNIL